MSQDTDQTEREIERELEIRLLKADMAAAQRNLDLLLKEANQAITASGLVAAELLSLVDRLIEKLTRGAA